MASRHGGRSTMKKRSSHRERRSSRSSRSSLILPLTLFGEPASLTGEPTRIGERGPTSDPIPARLAGEPGRLAGEPDRLTGGPGWAASKVRRSGPASACEDWVSAFAQDQGKAPQKRRDGALVDPSSFGAFPRSPVAPAHREGEQALAGGLLFFTLLQTTDAATPTSADAPPTRRVEVVAEERAVFPAARARADS